MLYRTRLFYEVYDYLAARREDVKYNIIIVIFRSAPRTLSIL